MQTTNTANETPIDLIVQRLLTAYEIGGQEHAKRCFQAFTETYKLKHFEAVVVRERFQKALAACQK